MPVRGYFIVQFSFLVIKPLNMHKAVNCGFLSSATAKFPPEKFPQQEDKGGLGMTQPQPTGPKKVVLNSGDELFGEIRDLNFSGVGIVLSRRAKQISAAFEVSNVYVEVLQSNLRGGGGQRLELG